jgi:glutaredoxin
VVVLAVGLSVLGLAAWDNSSAGLPWNMPRFWHSQRTACLWLAVACIAFGLFVVVRGPREATPAVGHLGWQATRPGGRFRSVTVYTRKGCHLCDEAIELLQSYSAYLPAIQEVDIDADPALRQQWDTCVPVVEIDGKVRFKGYVSEMLLRRLIEGSPPS